MNDSLIWDEIKSNFPYLTLTYDKCPVSILNSKLGLNQALKELGSEIVSWAVERFDKEINYHRVSLTLPSGDRYIGEGCSPALAQKAAAYKCLTDHPVLSIGDDGIDRRNYWSELSNVSQIYFGRLEPFL